MDNIDLRIIDILQTDGRITMKELGQRVGLTSPATIERVKKLEESGIIGGYRADIDIVKAGLPVKAFILVTIGGCAGDALINFCRNQARLLECHRLAGSASYLISVAVTDTAELEKLLDELAAFGRVETHLVLSTPFTAEKINLP
ncbi:Lrp/AsnC family transcriptional regulator [Anaeroselena agilis]|uniref:Lrp/AsnC family transcriptional regulator n=1 Tax=Anaeroselena agilis TaxID=3063788 RepID=A0ABU3NVM3_9FIRM|nr:Lrp/AsnC family transcriptional regulator [Selenomonadales bacterium 4137-cl]